MHTYLKRIYTGVALGLCFWLSLVYTPPIIFQWILLTILSVIIGVEWQRFFNIKTPTFWFVTPFYPLLPFLLLLYLNGTPRYHDLLLFLFVMVSSYDTGAYLVGSLLGKHKIAPRISPGKSWEGLCGGYLFSYASFMLLSYEYALMTPRWFNIGFTLITCTCACLGDLFESWLKRRAHIKDSGSSLPGHGGFLDRFDGILGAVFFFYLFKDILIQKLNM